MRLTDITWPRAEAYFQTSDTVILGVGSVECHGRHNPLGVDTLVPDHLIARVERKLPGVLIAPTIPYGAAESLSQFPGTIDIGPDTLYALLSRVTDSLYRHGARRFIVVNGHGGNMRAIDRVGLDLYPRGALLAELNWWTMVWDMNPAWKGGHGGAEETAAVMAIDESLVDKSEIGGPLRLTDLSPEIRATGFGTAEFEGVTFHLPRPIPAVTDNGWIGPDHPENAASAWGEEMLAACAEHIARFVGAFGRAPLPDAKEA